MESSPKCLGCVNLEEKFDALQENFAIMFERQNFLKNAISDIIVEGIKSNIQKMELKENDIVTFNLSDELVYDSKFFEEIQPIFQELNVSVIVLHKDIQIDIITKGENNG